MKKVIPGFIKFTNSDGQKILLNVDKIESVGKDTVIGKGCNIVIQGEDVYSARETMAAIEKRILAARMPEAIIAHKIAHPPLNIRMADNGEGVEVEDAGQPEKAAPSRKPA